MCERMSVCVHVSVHVFYVSVTVRMCEGMGMCICARVWAGEYACVCYSAFERKEGDSVTGAMDKIGKHC